MILPDVISREPLGPLVRKGDPRWLDVVRWTLNALIAAEENGVTQANAEARARDPSRDRRERLCPRDG